MADAKAAISAGIDKAKAAAIVGVEEAKAVALVGALKVKSGTSAGIKWFRVEQFRIVDCIVLALNDILLRVFIVLVLSGISTSNDPPTNFVFGDSLVDVGNNNYNASLSRANFFPFGQELGIGLTPLYLAPTTDSWTSDSKGCQLCLR
ncbi:GDSL esterase/lipase [Sesbania bispinosa]|nr:GDSL esterase/lipase [Sesbania bispinosa]